MVFTYIWEEFDHVDPRDVSVSVGFPVLLMWIISFAEKTLSLLFHKFSVGFFAASRIMYILRQINYLNIIPYNERITVSYRCVMIVNKKDNLSKHRALSTLFLPTKTFL